MRLGRPPGVETQRNAGRHRRVEAVEVPGVELGDLRGRRGTGRGQREVALGPVLAGVLADQAVPAQRQAFTAQAYVVRARPAGGGHDVRELDLHLRLALQGQRDGGRKAVGCALLRDRGEPAVGGGETVVGLVPQVGELPSLRPYGGQPGGERLGEPAQLGGGLTGGQRSREAAAGPTSELGQERVELALDIVVVGELRDLGLGLATLPLQLGHGLVRRLRIVPRRQVHPEHGGRSAAGDPDRVLLQYERQRLDVHRLVAGRHGDLAASRDPGPVRIDGDGDDRSVHHEFGHAPTVARDFGQATSSIASHGAAAIAAGVVPANAKTSRCRCD